jgi:hypothetical protein
VTGCQQKIKAKKCFFGGDKVRDSRAGME